MIEREIEFLTRSYTLCRQCVEGDRHQQRVRVDVVQHLPDEVDLRRELIGDPPGLAMRKGHWDDRHANRK